jgi:uncharacterized protein YydD (DUF2326 family)
MLQGPREVLKVIDFVRVETSAGTSRVYEDEACFDDIQQFFTETGFVFAGKVEQMLHPERSLPL